MSFRTIRQAQTSVWPAVKKSIELQKAARDEVRENPRGATRAAQTRAALPWNRVVANETVWAIAKADLLMTPEHAGVIDAAREWVASWDEDILDDMDAEERRLYAAVQALATAFEPEDTDEK